MDSGVATSTMTDGVNSFPASPDLTATRPIRPKPTTAMLGIDLSRSWHPMALGNRRLTVRSEARRQQSSHRIPPGARLGAPGGHASGRVSREEVGGGPEGAVHVKGGRFVLVGDAPGAA